MPVLALGALWVWACMRAGDPAALTAACAAAGVGLEALAAELDAGVRLRDGVQAQGPEYEPLARTMAVARQLRGEFAERVLAATAPGRTLVRQLGNLYTASLPAWIAAAFADAHARGLGWDGRVVTLIGYGSGDAAEVWPCRVVPGWRDSAGRIDLEGAIAGAIDLERAEYEALHARRATERALPPAHPFAITGRGHTYDRSWQDVGVVHYGVTD